MKNIFKFDQILQWNKYGEMLKIFSVKYFTANIIMLTHFHDAIPI